MVEIEKDYRLYGPDGTRRLIEISRAGRSRSSTHFMFEPEWEDDRPSGTAGTDDLSPGFLEHLHTIDASYDRNGLRHARASPSESRALAPSIS